MRPRFENPTTAYSADIAVANAHERSLSRLEACGAVLRQRGKIERDRFLGKAVVDGDLEGGARRNKAA